LEIIRGAIVASISLWLLVAIQAFEIAGDTQWAEFYGHERDFYLRIRIEPKESKGMRFRG